MPSAETTSVKKIIDEILNGRIGDDFNAEAMYQMNKRIEEKMKDFDIQKKIQDANALEELAKLVITA